MNWFEWLQVVQPGEVAVVVRVTLGDARQGRPWAEYAPEQHPVTKVTASHVMAGDLRFRRTWVGGTAGRSTSGDMLRPLADLEHWRVRARIAAAYNRLADLHDWRHWPGAASLLRGLSDAPHEAVATPGVAEALERLVSLREEMERVSRSAALEVQEIHDAFWGKSRSR